MTDVKSTLKEAREAIKKKDYQTSLRLCKSILKHDKGNYMALVFFGLSLQEVGPSNQAPNAFRKAVQANPKNPLAWNGLMNYYEKQNCTEAKSELIEVYTTMLDIETAENKLLEYCYKLLNLTDYGDLNKIAMAIYKLTKSNKCSKSAVIDICMSLSSLFSKIKELPKESYLAYEETLNVIISNKKTATIENYSTYLTLLHKQNKTEDLLQYAKKMHNLFELDTISLNWICKLCNESFVEDHNISDETLSIMNTFCDKLIRLNAQSSMALFTRAAICFKEDKISEAIELLRTVTSVRPGLLHAWILLTESFVILKFYDEALQASAKADRLLQSIQNSNAVLRKKLDYLLLEVKSYSKNTEDLKKAKEIYDKLDCEEDKLNCLPHLIRANINMGKYAEAKLLINEHKNHKNIADILKLLMAQLLRKQENYKGALKLLEEEDIEMSDWWIEVGTLYRLLGEYDKCLTPFLKAAKYDPNNYIAYLQLGHYYQEMNHLDKARRCYEKAFHINNKCSEAGIELSKMYRKQKKWDENIQLLESLTVNPINKKNCWAYLQLGLSYLEQENYAKAVDNLRYVVRIDTENINCWESLADAYLARGAYVSALKCYQRATELSENVLYPLLQIATIKQIMGNYAEANTDFQSILVDNKGYVPALKGLAETCMRQAAQCYRDQRLGTARDYCQCAADKITLAIKQQADLSCLWKIFADCCFFVARLPEKYCCLFIPVSLIENTSDKGNKLMEKEDLYTLATKSYCKAISLLEDNTLLWHDIGSCLLHHGLNTDNIVNAKNLIQKAFLASQNCTLKNPTHWQHWNLLGNVALHMDPPNYALAQHAFIKAVTIDHNSAVSWCNLGTMYLILGDIGLANKAFSKAQRSDPNYVNSWIGQALVAETLNNEEAMDLFRHSTQLGVHQQGGIGYGHWVCRTLLEGPSDATIYSIHNMHAISVACDALTWYTEKNPNDSCAWNMLGLLRERMGLKKSASDAFRNALHIASLQHIDFCRVNYGRTLSALEKYTKAIEMFKNVEEASFSSGSGLALALFKDKQYEESYEAYKAALDWLTDDSKHQSDLLVALASMAYMFQGQDAAKTLLFQSIKLKPPSPWSLYSTLSLGLIHSDLKLARLVLKELENFKDNKECLQHYVVLLSYVYLAQDNYTKVVREVSKLVHRHPDQASLWLTLSIVLLRLYEVRPPSQAAARCATLAMKLGQNNMDVTKVLCLVALGSFLIGDYKQAIIASQKAIHCYPDVAEGWSLLLCVMLQAEDRRMSNEHLQKTVKYIKTLNPSMPLNEWLKSQSILIT